MTERPTSETAADGDRDRHPWGRWRRAALDPVIDRSLRRIYAVVDAAARDQGVVCRNSGRCCRFDSFGHRLYVTGLEIAWVLAQVRGMREESVEAEGLRLQVLPDAGASDRHLSKGACVFQIERLCSVHRVRPLGCRVFFCEAGSEAWQHALYEQHQAVLRRLHEEQVIPYAYMEWRAGLAACRRWAESDEATA